jgi:putative CocE/NonD family hydrolase
MLWGVKRKIPGRVLALATIFALPWGLDGQTPPDGKPFDVRVERDIHVAVRDGVRLALDLYLPEGDGRRPVLLSRTPYDKNGSETEARWFAARGYAVVVNDCRGRYGSEGAWRMIVDDPADGFDVMEWIARQPWSAGKVGTFGTSYVGGTQHALACMRPPGLACMIPVDSLSNTGLAGVRHSGAFELRFMNWVFTIGAPNSRAALADPALKAALEESGKAMPQHLLRLPIVSGATSLRLTPDYEAWLIEAMRHGDYDAFWKQPGHSVIDNVERYADVPVYHVTGWYDSWCRQNVLNWQALSRAKRSPQKLIVGPWTHGGERSRFAGEIEFPPEAALAFEEWRLRWFDHWLKGAANGVESESPVKIFVMGGGGGKKTGSGRLFHGGRWRDEQEFPLARARVTPYFLHAGGRLGPDAPSEPSSSTTFTFDPERPVPTIGGNLSSVSGLLEPGGFDQRCRASTLFATDQLPLSERRDVLVFQSPPLDDDVEVTGPVDVTLLVASTAPDTDFTAKLVDVYPRSEDYPLGFDLNVGDSITRLRYRDSLERPELLAPGTPASVTIHLYPTSNLFAKGHRIRIDVSSSNFPRFDVNPNTGEPLQQHRRIARADNTVFHEAARASFVSLPIVPRS